MKAAKKIFKWFLTVFLMANVVLLVCGKIFFWKALIYNYVNIDDYHIFENRIVKTSSPVEWNVGVDYNKKEISDRLMKQLTDYRSVAFLIIKDDSLSYEKYWDGYSDSSLSSSFSMAKSIVSMMIGVALKERKIKNLDEPVANYLAEFKDEAKSKITIRHLLMMSSGLDWDEGYASLFSPVTEAYYGKDLYPLITRLRAKEAPGKFWEYKSCDTQLLGFILEKATGESLSDYCSKKIWGVIGARHHATWSLDHKNGHEKAYSAFNSNARDFARLGKLYLQKGNWSGVQVVDTAYAEASTHPNNLPDKETGIPNDVYGLQWWITKSGIHDVFYARGILGQYVIVIPDMKIIVVRLGHVRSTDENGKANDYPVYIEEVIKMYS